MASTSEEPAAPEGGYVTEDRPEAPVQPSGGYASPSTWDSRYEEHDGTFDWYADYAQLRLVFEDFIPPDPELAVLQLGCGNSAMSGQMHEAGYRKITNIDISAAAVKKMEEEYASLDMEWRVMDATAMTFEDSNFDLAVDKGTLDAMMHGGSEGEGLARAMTSEVWRTLRPGGLFVLVSHNGLRQPVLDNAVAAFGPSAEWDLLELRKCGLSPQAMLINIMRSKLNGRPLMEGFRDVEMLRVASEETKFALKQMQFLEAFRLFKAKKAQQQKAKAGEETSAAPVAKPKLTVDAEDGAEDEAPKDSRRQPYCWVYILRKPR